MDLAERDQAMIEILSAWPHPTLEQAERRQIERVLDGFSWETVSVVIDDLITRGTRRRLRAPEFADLFAQKSKQTNREQAKLPPEDEMPPATPVPRHVKAGLSAGRAAFDQKPWKNQEPMP